MTTNISSIFDKKYIIGEKVYLVGGCLRDNLLNKIVKDWDVVIEKDSYAFAKKVAEDFQGSFVEMDKENGVYRVILFDGLQIDFAKMQGNKIEEDLQHRDFTINGMAYDIEAGFPIKEKEIIDPFGGIKDLTKKEIKHIHRDVFKEDPIRMIRAVRLMMELHYNINHETIRLIKENANKINTVAGERVAAELFKILKAENAYFYLNYMDETLGILYELFPELEKMKEVGECKYHVVDCWTHSIYTVKMAEEFIYSDNYFEPHIREAYEEHTKEIIAGDRTRLDLIKLGALFHDVGKPSARKVDETGRTRFRGHEITGAEIIREYAEKLKLSIKERDILYRYVELHMIPLNSYKNNDVSGKVLYDIFNKMGEETLDILLIALSDIIATRKLLVPDEEMGMFKVHIEYIANNYLTRYRPLEKINSIITGKDIMESLEVPSGVMVGNLLEEIKKAIYFGRISPTKEAALNYLKSIF
ncbi:CCA tRNA nucleotidyltransferase [Alkaliphilus transvaalensis]|uniref:CCA tRNA nucleotidyltransferase n=1 Tax=Alkaliphilus transvaalensis TaxID=114628 RepID=UPI00047C801A|nr:HDIG domain-containing metalloprotein [Alkaliphilus transvaalensis]